MAGIGCSEGMVFAHNPKVGGSNSKYKPGPDLVESSLGPDQNFNRSLIELWLAIRNIGPQVIAKAIRNIWFQAMVMDSSP